MSEDKQHLRRRMLEGRAAQDAEAKRDTDRQITGQVLENGLYQRAACVFCYVSTPQEIDTHAILRHALAAGKTVCVPLCGARGEMTARRIRSLDELHAGAYGILEPDEAAEEIAPTQIDLVIAPALASDRLGYRLGYGGGYYDRFLARTGAPCMALCAAGRLVERLPHEPFDQRCNWIITERQVLRTDEK